MHRFYAGMGALLQCHEAIGDKAMALLERVGLSNQAEKHPSQLSGRQQQRVAIARALAMDPVAMLFDDPTSALDPEIRVASATFPFEDSPSLAPGNTYRYQTQLPRCLTAKRHRAQVGIDKPEVRHGADSQQSSIWILFCHFRVRRGPCVTSIAGPNGDMQLYER